MPQPIDPQTELGRLIATERIQQLSDRANLSYQVRMASQAAQQHVLADTQVQEAEQKSEQVEQELKRRNPFAGRRKRRKAAEETSESTHVVYAADEKAHLLEEPEVHKLDISI
ncbi:MAG: hypothetical protein HYV26_22490 [Candidatus Hydrogenedentes bacterium]|nr:hypothetical protein [Candidatus Hydrogenedentota bacterium]MBI3118853.1 hypothetical protein [Candidatus Hydrogenedentota bacterium]